jgi:hypothetical protein
MTMSPSLDLLLTHYRHELADLLLQVTPVEAPACPDGEELLWAEAGETAGWLPADRAMQVRRIAARLRFYEQRAGGPLPR